MGFFPRGGGEGNVDASKECMCTSVYPLRFSRFE